VTPRTLEWVLPTAVGLLLARATFVLERGLDSSEILTPAPGGYILYGALPAVGVVAVWLRGRGLDPAPYLDHASPWILTALVPGRIACWIVGCCAPVPLVAALGNTGLALFLFRRLRSGRMGGTAALGLAGHATLRMGTLVRLATSGPAEPVKVCVHDL
jgi:prolipoprotein diacylglyceryltransferase